jgi:phosphatidylglycerophosphatase C
MGEGAVSHVVFDFDGTLIEGDSTTRWLLETFKRSPLRFALAILLLPIALPMVILPYSRRRGASIFLWLATFGMDEADLERSLSEFARRFAAGDLAIGWRLGAVQVLEHHLAEGHRVTISTAAPECVVRPLLGDWESRIELSGSSMRRLAGGWVCSRHNYAREKCRSLEQAGHPGRWQFAYTDSIADRPLLENADQGFVINPGWVLRVRAAKIAEAQTW